MHPFLKWPGGKRWFIHKYSQLLPKKFKRYIEPFLGGGSVYFYLKPTNAILGDINPDIIKTYQEIKENWERVNSRLQVLHKKHSKALYYSMRNDTFYDSPATRMIYLNRTCFNGIYRVNSKGEYNVPIGTKKAIILATDNFEEISKLLQTAIIKECDFEILIDDAREGDFIFADPPYTVRHNNNGFVKYNENLFSWEDQVRLANALIRAQERNVKIVTTNASHNAIKELYKGHNFKLKQVSRYSSIAASGDKRKQYEELIITSK